MYTLRCTQRLLRRLRPDLTESVHSPSTALGDWYANILYLGRSQVVLCTSDRSLLSVLLPAKTPRELPLRLRAAVGSILNRIGVRDTAIRNELARMSDVLVGRSLSRSVLGSMNEIAWHCRWNAAEIGPSVNLEELALEMARMPMLTLKAAFPADAALQLLGAA